jgi:hypothetical protein
VSNNFQDGKATCASDPLFTSPVIAEVTGQDGNEYFSGEVSIGRTFMASNGGSNFSSEKIVTISTL